MNLIQIFLDALVALFSDAEPKTRARPPSRDKPRRRAQAPAGDASARTSLDPKTPGHYRKAGTILTPTEAKFCNVLLRCVPAHVGICPKVRIGDIVNVVDGLSWSETRRAQNHIFQKHVDFVLCDLTSYCVLAVVELDDPSHERPDRMLRDELVDSVLADAGLPILHVKTMRLYDEPGLSADILGVLPGTKPAIDSGQAAAERSAQLQREEETLYGRPRTTVTP